MSRSRERFNFEEVLSLTSVDFDNTTIFFRSESRSLMKASRVHLLVLLLSLSLSACNSSNKPPQKAQQVTVAVVQSQPVTITQQYVGQINSHHRIEVRAPESGKLVTIPIKEGQTVKQNDLLFQIEPKLGIGKEQQNIENDGTLVSITASFNGIVGRLTDPQGSMVLSGETLTTLSDNSLMRVYFNVPEGRYLQCQSDDLEQHKDDLNIELVLADGTRFDQPGTLGSIGAVANSKTGAIPFRADFPNPDHRLHHGQTGTVLMSRVQQDALVIPQRATFEIREKRYVYVVDKDNVVHQREIVIQNELDDVYVVKEGLHANDKIVVDGARQIRDGDKVEYQSLQPKKMIADLK